MTTPTSYVFEEDGPNAAGQLKKVGYPVTPAQALAAQIANSAALVANAMPLVSTNQDVSELPQIPTND
jgi:hypothetical protein